MFFLLPLYVLGSDELKEIFVFYFALEDIQTLMKFQSLLSQDLWDILLPLLSSTDQSKWDSRLTLFHLQYKVLIKFLFMFMCSACKARHLHMSLHVHIGICIIV